MPNKSRVILTENENSHRSRLIKSFKSFDNLEDYKTKPEGVWGSTAKIHINYKPHSLTENINIDITFKSEELDFEFDIPFDDNLEANEGEIVIYNLSDDTIAQLTNIIKQRGKNSKKESVTITAGYEGDTGVIFKGYMTKVSTVQENADRVTTIKVIDDIEEKVNLEETVSGSAKKILTDLIDRLVSKTNLSKGKIKIARDYTYSDSVTLDTPLESAIKDFSGVCGVSTFISKGTIYCCKLNEIYSAVNDGGFSVNTNTGMIGSPQPFIEEETHEDYKDTIQGFEIDMLLQHRMSVGALIALTSKKYSGRYYVKSGSHTFNESECITHIKAIEVV